MGKKIVTLLTILAIIFTVAIFTPDTNAGIQTLNLSKQTKEIKVGESFQLTMTGVKASAIKWKSSKPNVATVSKRGVVKGVKAGTANITGKYKNLKFTIAVKVTEKSSTSPTTSKPAKGGQLIYSDSKVDFYYIGQSKRWNGNNSLNFRVINKFNKTTNWSFVVFYINGSKIDWNEYDTAMPNMECTLQIEVPKGVEPNTIKGILHAFRDGSEVYQKDFEYTIK